MEDLVCGEIGSPGWNFLRLEKNGGVIHCKFRPRSVGPFIGLSICCRFFGVDRWLSVRGLPMCLQRGAPVFTFRVCISPITVMVLLIKCTLIDS